MQDYIVKDNKRLRFGYTTGSCAAAPPKQLPKCFCTEESLNRYRSLPERHGTEPVSGGDRNNGYGVSCCIRKDSGDDPDVTNGIRVYAEVSRTNDMGMIELSGGIGVGRVTKPGWLALWEKRQSIPCRDV
jgi:cobalt-precorrin-5B (C1)-methyltransferase